MPSERKALIFPFCWFSTLAELDDSELRAMLAAIGSYAETGTKPEFKGAMKALWNEIQQRLDHDREQYSAVCERNREKALKRWNSTMPQHTTACHGMPQHADACQAMPNDTKNTNYKLKLKSKAKEEESIIPLTVVPSVSDEAAAPGRRAEPIPFFPRPSTAEDILELADRAGAKCTKEQAELYLASRQSVDWLDRNGKPIRNLGANLKAWLLTYEQIRKDDEKRRNAATGNGGGNDDAEYRERKAKRDAELRKIYGDAEFERLHREGRL